MARAATSTSFDPPVRERVAVTSVRPREDGDGFDVATSDGTYLADQVVVATGGYHVPRSRGSASGCPTRVAQVHSSRYRNPGSAARRRRCSSSAPASPARRSPRTCMLAGREVHLAVGHAPALRPPLPRPRRHRLARGHRPLRQAGHRQAGRGAHAGQDEPLRHRTRRRPRHRPARLRAAGHDAARPAARHRRRALRFADDLERQPRRRRRGLQRHQRAHRRPHRRARTSRPPDGPSRYAPVWRPDGYRGSSVPVAERGRRRLGHRLHPRLPLAARAGLRRRRPPAARARRHAVPGLYFIGLPWQHTWGSGRFAGLDRDAGARRRSRARVAAQRRSRRRRPAEPSCRSDDSPRRPRTSAVT